MFKTGENILYNLVVLIAVLAFSLPAHAQDLAPEVQIDTSILRDLNPSGTGADYDYKAVPLKRPATDENFQPSLTPPTPKVIQFPVQSKTRTDSSNPAVPTERTIAHYGILNAPLPGRKPHFDGNVAVKLPPLPKKRPYTKDMALVAELKALRENPPELDPPLPEKKVRVPATPMKPKKTMGSPLQNAPRSMPAMPAGKVAVEVLPGSVADTLPAAGDDLAASLVELDRQAVLDTIEAMGIEDNAVPVPLPEPKPPELVKTTAARLDISNQADLIDITAKPESFIDNSAPAQPEMEIAAYHENTRASSSGESNGSVPFKLVSLPFSAGFEELDGQTAAMLEDKILPSLQNHPLWQVQIQSFASASGKNMNSARRLSLSRALNVRAWLLDRGVEARRMEVRALGSETDKKPLDRVDFILYDPQAPAN